MKPNFSLSFSHKIRTLVLQVSNYILYIESSVSPHSSLSISEIRNGRAWFVDYIREEGDPEGPVIIASRVKSYTQYSAMFIIVCKIYFHVYVPYSMLDRKMICVFIMLPLYVNYRICMLDLIITFHKNQQLVSEPRFLIIKWIN